MAGDSGDEDFVFFTLKDGWFLSKEMLVNLDEDGVFLPYKIVVRDDKGS